MPLPPRPQQGAAPEQRCPQKPPPPSWALSPWHCPCKQNNKSKTQLHTNLKGVWGSPKGSSLRVPARCRLEQDGPLQRPATAPAWSPLAWQRGAVFFPSPLLVPFPCLKLFSMLESFHIFTLVWGDDGLRVCVANVCSVGGGEPLCTFFQRAGGDAGGKPHRCSAKGEGRAARVQCVCCGVLRLPEREAKEEKERLLSQIAAVRRKRGV